MTASMIAPPPPIRTASRTAVGLGPHGERPATPDLIALSPADLQAVRARAYRVAIVLHTTGSDWAKRQIAGITEVLGTAGATVTCVVDCSYEAGRQADALARLVGSAADAVIVIPVGGAAVSGALRRVAATGTKLVLLDNAPAGLLPDSDYVSVVSSDNFGLGEIAAQLLAPHVRTAGGVGVVTYKHEFFASAQREIAFCRWMARHRPDLRLHQAQFDVPSEAGAALAALLGRQPDLGGLFIVWDEPAMACMEAARAKQDLAMTTVDLGAAIAAALAEGTLVKGVAAQRPYEQGRAAALATLAALLGRSVPPWVVVPGIAVTSDTVADVFATVGGTPALLKASA
jgi:ribose transport system substrate-binding protein